ncbi:MAG TPA: hypothetical protein VGO62_00335, partial [Myxococcota bacterium]
MLASLRCAGLAVVAALAFAVAAHATTSAGVAPSPMGGNGHSLTFDGRVFIVAEGDGWELRVLRPELVTTSNGFTDVSNAFSPSVLIQPAEQCENALALCHEDAAAVPYACGDDGNATADGPFACYDLVVFDSNACGNGAENALRYRDLKVWIQSPGTPDAAYYKHQWTGDRTPLLSS